MRMFSDCVPTFKCLGLQQGGLSHRCNTTSIRPAGTGTPDKAKATR